MDKSQALHGFWSSFDLTAYDENTVPDGSQLPYITYSVSLSEMGYTSRLTASLWYHSLSWAAITQKADEINSRLGYGGILIPYDSGRIWLKRGMPFAQRMADPSDAMIRRIVLTVEAEYLSED